MATAVLYYRIIFFAPADGWARRRFFVFWETAGAMKKTRQNRLVALLLIAIGCAIYFFANFLRVAVPGTIFDELQAGLELSASQVTGLGSFFMYPYALAQLPVGLLVARYGGRRTIAGSCILFLFGALLFPLAQHYALLAFSRLVTGVGSAGVFLSLIDLTVRTFRRHAGIFSGFVVMIGYTGGIVATAPFSWAVARFSWRPTLLFIGFLVGVAYALFLLLCRAAPPRRVRAEVAFHPGIYFRLLKNPANRHFCFYCLNFGVFYVLVTVLGKKFLEDVAGFSGERAAAVFSVVVACSAIGNGVLGFLSRLAGNRRKLFFLLPTVTCSLTVLASMATAFFGWSGWLPAVGIVLLAFFSSTNSITIPYAMEINAPGQGGLVIGMLNSLSYLMVAVLGNLGGVVLDLFTPETVETGGRIVYPPSAYGVIFGVLFLMSLVTLRQLSRLPETYGRRLAGPPQ